MSKKTVSITDWAIIANPYQSEYTAPELITKVLTGRVFGHPDIEEGQSVVTSTIEKIDLDNNLVETSNTIYRLEGEAEEGYRTFLEEYKKGLN